MARSEADVLSSLATSLPTESSLTRMLKTFNAANSSIPVSLSEQLNGDHKKTNGAENSVQFKDEKHQLTRSDDAAYCISPPVHTVKPSLCCSLDNTPAPVTKIVGTPDGLRRHISENEFLRSVNKKLGSPEKPASPTTSDNNNKTVATQQQPPQKTVSLEFKRVPIKKSSSLNATPVESVDKSSQPVVCQRQVGFNP